MFHLAQITDFECVQMWRPKLVHDTSHLLQESAPEKGL